MDRRKLEFKAELLRRDIRYRELAARLDERGFDAGEYDIARIVAGRMEPHAQLRAAIADILKRPAFELFVEGVRK